MSKWHILWKLMMMTEIYEFEYNALEEMLIVNYQEGFSYNMCYEDDVYSVTSKLNEQQLVILKLDEDNTYYMVENLTLKKENNQLKEENEQLRKQIQNYEQLISNSYVGEEETLDGFVGKYVIWEDELQKYKEKIKKVIDDE